MCLRGRTEIDVLYIIKKKGGGGEFTFSVPCSSKDIHLYYEMKYIMNSIYNESISVKFVELLNVLTHQTALYISRYVPFVVTITWFTTCMYQWIFNTCNTTVATCAVEQEMLTLSYDKYEAPKFHHIF
jgi:hypothetical protein